MHLGDIHAPVHCDFCGRLGDWLLPCRCEHGTHNMSDDSVYSSGHLGIHWDSDIDTAEFLETEDEETDDEDSVNNTNQSTSVYFQSTPHSYFYFISWFLHSFFSIFSIHHAYFSDIQ